MKKGFYFIRKITVPPVFAILFLLTLYGFYPAYFNGLFQLICGLFFLGVLPLLGYPLQKYIPHFKDKGREGQRTLAMIFSMAGYLLGTLVSFVWKSSAELHIVYFLYLLCGVTIFVFNKGFHLKASGHACGITGPFVLFVNFGMYIPAIIAALIIIPVMISSVKTKRHTGGQLLGGSLIAFGCMAVIRAVLYFI